MNHRDRQILCGLFLSKYDNAALKYLGFETFTEAFNALGYGLNAKPSSIKNYRDELDPFFPNARRGWHKRPLREHCQKVFAAFHETPLKELGELIKSFLVPTHEAEVGPEIARVLRSHSQDASSPFAKRLITGRAAEHYFTSKYLGMAEFSNTVLTDTTTWGCGFDFKLKSTVDDIFCAVEVKGLRNRCGQIQMTELEYEVAQALNERYFLVLIRNFVEHPFHTIIQNPAQSALQFKKAARRELRYTWQTNVAE